MKIKKILPYQSSNSKIFLGTFLLGMIVFMMSQKYDIQGGVIIFALFLFCILLSKKVR